MESYISIQIEKLTHVPSAICLVVSWLILISLQLHKLIRRFQSLGRAESYVTFVCSIDSFLPLAKI